LDDITQLLKEHKSSLVYVWSKH